MRRKHPARMTRTDALREAFARDLIDLETFERFTGYETFGVPYVLPWEVASILRASRTDEPGAVVYYDPPGKGFDWGDGRGPVHSRPKGARGTR